jgi:hypothetical protein
MPEPEDTAPSGLQLPAGDPAASAVEALRAMAAHGPVVASAELAAFFDDPAGQGSGTIPHPRSDLVTVVRLPIRRAGRVAVAVGAALALAALGGVAVAATGGAPDREPAQVQLDDPSDTTTTTETTSTETETAEPEESETTEAEPDEPQESAEDAEDADAATHTANPVASANHHDGVGSDDEHADVNGGGEIDHRAEHSPTAHPTKADHADDDADEDDDQGEDQQGEDSDSQRGGGSHQG